MVSEPRRGYGYACAAGVAEFQDADVLVFLDGDHSFAPSDLPSLLAPIEDRRVDLVLGSRTLGHIAPGAMPPHQRFGNWLVSRLMNALYGLSITDLGPYRAIRRQLLMELDMREMTYGWPTEMIVKAAIARRQNHGSARWLSQPQIWSIKSQRNSARNSTSGLAHFGSNLPLRAEDIMKTIKLYYGGTSEETAGTVISVNMLCGSLRVRPPT